MEHCEQLAAAGIPFIFDPGQGMPMFSGEELLQAVASLRGEGGVMLFKGSRGCRMEQYYSFMERAWA